MAAALPAWAADDDWQDHTFSNLDWFDGANWNLGSPPTSGQSALLNNLANADVNSSAVFASLTLSNNSRLTVLEGGSLGSGSIDLDAGSEIYFNNTTALSIDNAFSGAGTINFFGAPTFTLNAASTNTGMYLIDGGTIKAGGTNFFSADARYNLRDLNSAATLDLNGFDQTIKELDGNTDASLVIGDQTLTLGGGAFTGISGFKGLITGSALADLIIDTGTFVIENDNPGFTGTTTVHSGAVLQFATAGIGSIGGGIVNDGLLLLNNGGAGTLTVANNISGAGEVRDTNFGDVLLTGNNFYSGDTTFDIAAPGTLKAGSNTGFSSNSVVQMISGATLDLNGFNSAVAGVNGSAGTVTIGGAWLFVGGNGASSSFGGVISGSGLIGKAGGGTFTLEADVDASGYTGGTFVNQGTLQVDGDLTNSASVEIRSNANVTGVLSGTGTVPTVSLFFQAGNTAPTAPSISPGDGTTPGTLNVQGDVNFDSGTRLLIHLEGTSAALLAVTGAVDLSSAPLLQFDFTSPTDGTYTILTATGGVTNQFDSGVDYGGLTGFTPSIIYQSNAVLLQLDAWTYNWTGASSTDWNDDANWDDHKPGSGVNGTFDTAASDVVDIDEDTTVGGLVFTGDAFAFNVNATLDGNTTFTLDTTGITNCGCNIQTFNINGDDTDGTDAILALTGGANGNDAAAVVMSATHSVLDISSASSSSIPFGSLAGGGEVHLGANTLSVGNIGDDTIYAGVISGSGGLEKTGAGALTLNGTNTYTGTTKVFGGTLVLGSLGIGVGHIESTAAITIGNGTDPATLAGNGYTNAATVEIKDGATLAPGVPGAGGLLEMNSAALTFGSGATLEAIFTGTDLGQFYANTADLGGATLVFNVTGGSYSTGTIYTIATTFSGYTGTFGTITGAGDFDPHLVAVVHYNATDITVSFDATPDTYNWTGAAADDLWDTAGNWDNAKPGSGQTGVFGATGDEFINFTADATTTVGGLQFDSGADQFEFVLTAGSGAGTKVVIDGDGIIDDSSNQPFIDLLSDDAAHPTELDFTGDASADDASIGFDGPLNIIRFQGNSSAADSEIIPLSPDAVSEIHFEDNSTAFFAEIFANQLFASGTASLDRAVISIGEDGLMQLDGASDGGQAEVFLDVGSVLDITGHDAGTVNLGSIDGFGTIRLGDHELRLEPCSCSPHLFAGTIEDYSAGTHGAFTLAGEGLQILDATGTYTYTGQTTVDSGDVELEVDGDITSSSGVVVEAGLLSGSGILPTTAIHNGGALSPGGFFFDTLTINGDLTYEADTTTLVDIDDTPDSDLISVSGAASLDGILEVELDLFSTFTAGTSYTVLSAAGGVSGGYTLDWDSGLLDPGLSIDGGIIGNNYVIQVADDFTWKVNPTDGAFNTDSNWVGGVTPGSSDTAIFGASSITAVDVPSGLIGGMTFGNAANFIFTIGASSIVTLTSTGIVNNSSTAQTFDLTGFGATLDFNGASDAADTVFNVSGQVAAVRFNGTGSAGSSTITVSGTDAYVAFNGNSDAGGAAISLTGTRSSVVFTANGQAGSATVTAGDGTIVGVSGHNPGTVSIGSLSGGNATVYLGDITLELGALELNDTFGGVIDGLGGAGGLNKVGAGTLILTGDSTYTGLTTISGGVLQIGNGLNDGSTGSIVGDVTISGAFDLAFNRFGDSTYAGAITGGGAGSTIQKSGAGTLTLGGTSSYVGVIDVNAGTLLVDGIMGASDVMAFSGSTAGGTGTMGTLLVASAATLATGDNGIGLLTVVSGATLSSGSTFAVDLNGTSSDELVVSGGSAVITGSALAISHDLGATYTRGTVYTILTSTGLTGTFGSVSGTSLGSNTVARVSHDSTTVYLTLGASDFTWKATPGTNVFQTGANWEGGTTPGGSDVAEFETSSITSLVVSTNRSLAGMHFNPGADAFTFDIADASLSMLDTGIVNDAGNGHRPTFNLDSDGVTASIVRFASAATAGDAIFADIGTSPGTVRFDNTANAGTASIDVGLLEFYDTTSAASAQITVGAAASATFYSGSTAGTAGITNNGSVYFYDSSNPGSATIGNSGSVFFIDTPAASALAITNQTGGVIDATGFTGSTLTIGSISGSGSLALGPSGSRFVLATNGDHAFSGDIETGGGGDLEKSGTGTLTLTGTNSFDGDLVISNASGTVQIGDGTDGTTSLVTASVSGAGTIVFDNSDDVTVGSDISANLGKKANGELALTGAISAATVTIESGSLRVGDGTTGGAIGGSISNAGTLVFDPGSNLSLDITISGAGDLYKEGSHELTLITDSIGTMTGTMHVTAGTLQLGGGGAGGMVDWTIVDDAALAFNLGGPSDHTYVGSISGTGTVEIGGTATIIWTNTNTYSGTTSFGATGVLRAGEDDVFSANSLYDLGTSGTLDLDGYDESIGALAGGASSLLALDTGELDISNGSGGPGSVFTGAITGSGFVHLSGNTDLTLGGDLSGYTGNMAVDSGSTLRLGQADNTGILDSSTEVSLDGTLVFNHSSNPAFSNRIYGGATGAIEVADNAKVTLTGDNSGFDGTVSIGTGATLTISGANALDSDVTNSGDLIFDASVVDITDGGAISGSGDVTVNGTHTVTLTNTSISADIGLNGKLSIAMASDGEYSGSLSGAGALSFDGSAVTTVSGDSSSFSGPTTVNSGTLLLTGSLGGSAVTIKDGATLQDPDGTVGSLVAESGATVKVTGTDFLHVNDTLDLQDGSLLELSLDGASSSSIDAGGAVTIAGDLTLHLGIDTYSVGASYTLISTTATITGTFGTVNYDTSLDSFGPGITAVLHYNSNSVVLVLEHAAFPWASNPPSTADWTDTASWENGVVPSSSDTASFGASSNPNPLISNGESVTIAELDFLGGAPAYTITVDGTTANAQFTINGAGVSDASSNAPLFVLQGAGDVSTSGRMVLINATLDDADVQINAGGNLTLNGTSDAGSGTITVDDVGIVGFRDSTDASSAHLVLHGDGSAEVATTATMALNSLEGSDDSFVNLSGAGLTLVGSGTSTFGGVIANSGAITVAAGELILTNTSTYTGGTTIDAGATLQLGDGTVGHDGTVAGSVTVTGTLALDYANSHTFATTISGAGALQILTTAQVTVTSDNAGFTGTTSIAVNGTLQLGNGGSSGTIGGAINGDATSTLLFNHNSASPFGLSGNIAVGSIHQTGAGHVDLYGDVTGALTIDSGTEVRIGNGGAGGTLTGDVANSGLLVFDRDSGSPYTYASVIGGSGAVQIGLNGTGTITFTGVQTYIGDTTVEGGATLTAGAANVFSSGSAVVLCDCSTLDLASFNQTIAGLTGGGQVHLGSATLTISGFTGGLYSGVISGSGNVELGASQTVTFTNANTYTGTTTIGAAVTFVLADDAFNPTKGNLTGNIVDDGVFILQVSGTTNVAGSISGSGGLIKQGDGTVTALGGNNTYSGTTDIQAGTLKAKNGVAFSANSDFIVENVLGASILDLGSYDQTIHGLSGDGTVALNGHLTTGASGGFGQFDGTFTGNGGLTQVAGGTLVLTGNYDGIGAMTVNGVLSLEGTGNHAPSGGATLGIGGNLIAIADQLTLSFVTGFGDFSVEAGRTIITDNVDGTLAHVQVLNDGILQISDGPSGANLGSNVLLQDAASQLVFARYSGISYFGVISGSGSVTQSGLADLTLTGNNTYSGTTTIASGTLTVGQNGTSGTIGSGDIIDDGELTFSRSNAITVANKIAGSGLLRINGDGVLTLTNTANSYAGGTLILGSSVLAIDDDRELGDANGDVLLSQATLRFQTQSVTSGAGRDYSITSNGGTFDVRVASTINGNITGTGAGVLTKTGSANLILNGVNTYNGATHLNAGRLSVNGSIANSTVTVASGATLGGTGSVGAATVQAGGTIAAGNSIGTLHIDNNLTLAANAHSVFELNAPSTDQILVGGAAAIAGDITLASLGSLAAGHYTLINAVGLLTGTFTSINTTGSFAGFAATVSYDTHNVFVDLELSGMQWKAVPGTGDWNTGTNWVGDAVPTSADNAIFDVTTIANIGVNQATAVNGLIFVATAPAYTFNIAGTASGDASLTVNGGINNSSANTQTLIASGAGGHTGTLTFAGFATADAVLTANAGGTIALTADADASGSRVTVNSGGTLTIAGLTTAGTAVGSLEGTGGNVDVGAKALTAGALNTSTVYAGTTSGTGSLTKTGSGTLTLTGAAGHTGGTTTSSGTLQIGNGGGTGSIAGAIVDNATLAFNRSGTLVVAGAISGSGAVQQNGSGTTALTGAGTWNGGTTISAGTLQLGNGGTTGSLTGNVTDNGTFAFNRSDNITFAGLISGNGGVTQKGAGTTTLTADNTFSGTTLISSGALSLGDGSSAAGSVGGNITDNATLIVNHSGSFTLAGLVSGSGVFLNAGGTTILTKANFYAGGTTIASGSALQLGNGGNFGSFFGDVTDNGTLTIDRSDVITFGPASGGGSPSSLIGGVVSGSGAFVQMGSGTTMLTASNSYTGGTSISGGTLQIGDGGVTGSIVGNVTDNSVFAIKRSDTITLAGTISGSGSLVQKGSGTTILTADNTYGGGTTISSGTLQLGNGGSTGSLGSGNVLDNGVLAFNWSGNIVVANAITGSGSLQQNGSGSTYLTATNTYSGGATISAGALVLANGTAGNALGGNVLDNALFAVYRSDTLTFSGVITGTGVFSQSGSGTTILTADSDYAGGTIVEAGSLHLGNGGTTGSVTGDVRVSDAILAFDRSNTLTIAGVIFGNGQVQQIGTGTTVLTGANTYSGTTTISSGILQIGSGGASGSLGSGAVNDNAVLAFNRSDTVTVANAISGSGELRQIGPGTTILTANDNYSGGTTISSGTLQLGNGGATGGVTGNIVDNGALVVDRSGTLTLSGTISGSGSLTKLGSGSLVLSGIDTYAGPTAVNAGTLSVDGSITSTVSVADGATLGGTGTVGTTAVASGGTLAAGDSIGTLHVSGDLTLDDGAHVVAEIGNGVTDQVIMTGAVSLAGDLMLVGSGGVYSAGQYTLINSTGLLTGTFTTVGNSASLGGFDIDLVYDAHDVFLVLDHNGVRWSTNPGTGDWNTGSNWLIGSVPTATDKAFFGETTNSNITIGQATAIAGMNFGVGAPAYTFTIAGSAGGDASLTVGGSGVNNASANKPAFFVSGTGGHTGTLTFADASSGDAVLNVGGQGTVAFTGAADGSNSKAVVNAGGTLTIAGASGTPNIGSIEGDGSIVLGANTLSEGGLNTSTTFSGVISGSGGLTKTGSGTLTLAGANTYTGTTTISGGTIAIGNGGTTGSVAGDIADNGVLAFNRSNTLTVAGAISGSGSVQQNGSGTTILTGANTYTGTTVIAAGMLQVGNGGTGGSIETTSAVNDNGALVYKVANDRVLAATISGTGSLALTGTAKITLTADNTYTGGTTISSGTLELGNATATGSVVGNIVDNGALVLNHIGVFTFGNAVSGTGSLENKNGLTFITGTNTYTGGTTIDAFTELFIGNGGTVGSIVGNVLDNGALSIRHSDTVTLAGVISGTGQVFQEGTGTTILTAANTYSGGTTINTGTLQIGNGGTTGSIAGNIADSGTLAFNRSDAITFGGTISGSGALRQAGTGTTILTANDNYSGGTTITAGTLQLGNGGTTGAITGDVTDNGTLAFNRSDAVLFAGLISGSGAVRQIGNGTTVLTANNTYTGGTTITAGTLQLGNGGASGTVAGNVTDNGTLAFNRTDTFTFAGVISGTGALVQGGTGVTILSGLSTYSGPTSVTAGMLRAGATNAFSAASAFTVDSALDLSGFSQIIASLAGSGTVGLTSGAALTTGGSNASTTFSGAMMGTGSLVKSGSGTFTLTGTNTYSGGTTISGGTLQLGNGGTTGSIIGNVTDNGALAINHSNNVLFDGTISGTGSVVQSGVGMTALTATNTYSGGTTISAGTLIMGNGGATGSIVGNVTDNAAFAINRSDNLTFAGVISGSGSFTKYAANTLILTGDNTYTGGTIIAGGILQLGNGGTTGGVTGNIVNNGGLIINRSNTLTLAGVISGPGGLQQAGTGMTVLSGISTYSGATLVTAGILDVNGSIANSAVTLNGGTLKGNGTVGSLTILSGSVAPGNSIGTITVAGNIGFAAGTTYQVEVDNTGAGDRINAGGTATIGGGTVQVIATPGNYALQTTYRIINAAGGVTGTFNGLTVDLPFFDAALLYGGTTVDLVLRAKTIDFGPLATTPNQTATGNAINAGTFNSDLYKAFLNQASTAFVPAALDALSGEIHPTIRTAMIEDSRNVRQAILDRLRQAHDGGNGGGVNSRAVTDDTTMWLRVFTNWGEAKTDGNAGTMGRSYSGIVAGVDTGAVGAVRLGLAGGYTHDSTSVNARSSKASSNDGHIAGYAGWGEGALSARFGVEYAWGNATVTRVVQFPGFLNNTADKESHRSTQLFGEAGYSFKTDHIDLEPFGGFAWVDASTSGFAETGGIAALASNGASSNVTFSTLGLRLATDPLGDPGFSVTPRLTLAWQHAFGDIKPRQTVTFQSTSQSFLVLGVPLDPDALATQLGLDIQLAPAARLGLGYEGVLGSRVTSHAVRADFSWTF